MRGVHSATGISPGAVLYFFLFSAILCVSSLFMRLKHLLFHVALGHGFLAIGLVLEHIEGLFLAVHRNRVVPNHIDGML